MNAALVAIGVTLTLVPAALAGHGPRFRAGTIIRVSRLAMPGGLILVFTGMLATAIPAALEMASLSGLAQLCERLIHHMVVGGRVGTLVGGVIAVAIAVAALRGIYVARRRQSNTYVEANVGTHLHSADSTLVVLPLERHVAFASPGSPPQLVVSRGVVRDLSAEQRQVVVEHERAHIRGKHHVDLRVILAVESALGWLPGVHRGTGVWREALEWQADDAAAEAVGSRESVARTIKVWAGPSPAATLSFGGVERVERRLAYLNLSRPHARAATVITWLTIFGLWSASAVLVTRWLAHAHSLAIGASICPL